MSRNERSSERLIGLFCLGCILFSPLALTIFDRGADIALAGVPVLVFYLFVAWACLVAAMAIVASGIDVEDEAPAPRLDQAGPHREPSDA